MGPITLSTLFFRLFRYALSLLNIDPNPKEKKIAYHHQASWEKAAEIELLHKNFIKEFIEYQLMTENTTYPEAPLLKVPTNTPVVPTFFKRKDQWLDKEIENFEKESAQIKM